MASCEIPESRKEKNRNELNLEDDDQAAPQPLDDGKVETASLISSMKEEAPTTETEAEAEVEVEAAEDAVEDDEEEDDNLSLSDLTCSSSGAEEEADEDAFAIDEASLVGVMEPCRQKKAADGDELAAQDDLEKEQLEHIVSLCQIIRQRLANISAQLQRRTEELDEKILARQKERDLQKNKSRLHL